MDTVGAYEAKANLPKLLDRVAKGEKIMITRHGSPVAVLQPANKEKQVNVAAVVQKMRNLKMTHHLNGLPIRDKIEQGRK